MGAPTSERGLRLGTRTHVPTCGPRPLSKSSNLSPDTANELTLQDTSPPHFAALDARANGVSYLQHGRLQMICAQSEVRSSGSTAPSMVATRSSDEAQRAVPQGRDLRPG